MTDKALTKLDPEFKAKWVAALRSGEHKQGSANLWNNEDDTYCCLGVAGKVNGIPNHLMMMKSNPKTDRVYDSVCPGLSYEGRDQGIMGELIYLNDQKCKSFSEIAPTNYLNIVTETFTYVITRKA